jgi:hypothetical protein
MVRKLIAVLCVVGSFLALYNVYSDIAPVQRHAESVACAGKLCANLIGLERSPIALVFRFQVERNKATTAQVRCTRSFVLLGDYSCSKD